MAGAQPGIANIHVDKLLTNMSQLQVSEGMVADEATSVLPVDKESDKYFVYNLAHARVDQLERQIASNSFRFSWDGSQSTYNGVEYSAENAIDDRQREAADAPIDMDMDASAFLTEKLALDREFRVLGTLTTTTNYTNTSVPANKWDVAAGTPVADIMAAVSTTRASFRQANTLTIPAEVALEMAASSDVRNLAQYARDISKDISIPNPFLGLRVVIATARYLTSTEQNPESSTTGAVMGDDAIIHYVNPALGRRSFTHYVQFRNRDMQTRRFRDERIKSDVIEVSCIEALVRLVDVAGYMYDDVLT